MGLLDGWRFCPRCGNGITVDGAHAKCADGHEFYANPAPTVCAIVVRDGRLLLARRGTEPHAGKWDLPGGFLEEGEEPTDGLRRELKEETNLDVEVGQFLGVYSDLYGDRHTLNLYWLATADGEPEAGDDVTDAEWFAADELPPDDELAFENVRGVLRRWRDEQP